MVFSNKQYFLLSEIFYPDEISTGYVMTEIASKLSSEVPINVICGPPHFESEVYRTHRPLAKRININRVYIPKFSKNNIAGRILRIMFLSFNMFFSLLRKVKSGDTVFLVTNPPLLLLFIGLLKTMKQFKFIIIVHDVFPENAIPAGLIKENSFFLQNLTMAF